MQLKKKHNKKTKHTHTHTHTHTPEMGQRSKWIFFRRMYPDRYKAREKMLSVPNDWRNANQNDEGVIPKQQSLKSLQRTNAREGPKKRELTTLLVEIYTGNSHYGEQYRNPIQKKKNHRAPMRFQDFTPGWVCLQRKPSFQRTQAPQRCWWHYLQQPRHGTLK